MKKLLIPISLIAALYGVFQLPGQQGAQGTAGPFTAQQADAGRAAYETNCAGCHAADLSGIGNALPLAGLPFTGSWGNRTVGDLVGFMEGAMPPTNPGGLGEQNYLNITAFILQSNGARAGNQALTGNSTVAIRSVTGQVVAQIQGGQAKQGKQGKQGGRGAAPQAPRGLTIPGNVKNYTPVTDAMMRNPDPSDWLMIRHDYHANNYSTLNQISANNVQDLRLVWTWAMNEGTNQPAPVVHNGTMFINNPGNIVQALDAKTGELIWENRIGETATGNSQRGLAIYDDKVYVTTGSAEIFALDARTGKNVWHTVIGDRTNGTYSTSSGPIIAKGKVIQGLGGGLCDQYREEKCFISAYDAQTGKLIWKFYTIAKSTDPGGDSWGKLSDLFRAGGDTWITGSVDLDLNLTYWGVAQAKPWMRATRGSGNGATNYANSTVALDLDTGKLKWWFNHAPGETLDLDEVFERVLVDDQGQKYVFSAGKDGVLWKLDRTNGKFLDYVPMVFQNVFTSIDRKTGRGTYRADILNPAPGGSRPSCPAQSGGHNWPAASYVPEEDLIIFPLDQICVTSQGEMIGNYEAPASDGNMGRVSAYRVKDLKPVWTFQQRAPFLTSSMTTAGGIGFVGDWDRTFRAFDVKTGKTLWKTRLGTTAQGFPTTFTVDGEQFVAVPTGYNGGSPQIRPSSMFAFERNRPLVGHAVYVFALPKTE